MRRSQRRWFSVTFTMLCVAITASALQYVSDHLGDESLFSGWVLLAATAGLYLLPLRKKLIPHQIGPLRYLGPVAGWLQMHAYMGTFASVVFLMHIGWPVRGIFECLLAFSFVFVAATGIALGVLSRVTPRRLAAIQQDFPFAEIPAKQATIASDAHRLALRSSRMGEGATISEFYQRRLLSYFQSQRGLFYVLLPTGRQRRQLIRELNDLDRYLGADGMGCRQTLSQMVCSKDDLDYHHALQSRLRLFFAMHVALTWALAIMIGVHLVMVFRFQGAT